MNTIQRWDGFQMLNMPTLLQARNITFNQKIFFHFVDIYKIVFTFEEDPARRGWI